MSKWLNENFEFFAKFDKNGKPKEVKVKGDEEEEFNRFVDYITGGPYSSGGEEDFEDEGEYPEDEVDDDEGLDDDDESIDDFEGGPEAHDYGDAEGETGADEEDDAEEDEDDMSDEELAERLQRALSEGFFTKKIAKAVGDSSKKRDKRQLKGDKKNGKEVVNTLHPGTAKARKSIYSRGKSEKVSRATVLGWWKKNGWLVERWDKTHRNNAQYYPFELSPNKLGSIISALNNVTLSEELGDLEEKLVDPYAYRYLSLFLGTRFRTEEDLRKAVDAKLAEMNLNVNGDGKVDVDPSTIPGRPKKKSSTGTDVNGGQNPDADNGAAGNGGTNNNGTDKGSVDNSETDNSGEAGQENTEQNNTSGKKLFKSIEPVNLANLSEADNTTSQKPKRLKCTLFNNQVVYLHPVFWADKQRAKQFNDGTKISAQAITHIVFEIEYLRKSSQDFSENDYFDDDDNTYSFIASQKIKVNVSKADDINISSQVDTFKEFCQWIFDNTTLRNIDQFTLSEAFDKWYGENVLEQAPKKINRNLYNVSREPLREWKFNPDDDIDPEDLINNNDYDFEEFAEYKPTPEEMEEIEQEIEDSRIDDLDPYDEQRIIGFNDDDEEDKTEMRILKESDNKVFTISFIHNNDTYTGIIYATDKNEAERKFNRYCPSCTVERIMSGRMGFDYPVITSSFEYDVGWEDDIDVSEDNYNEYDGLFGLPADGADEYDDIMIGSDYDFGESLDVMDEDYDQLWEDIPDVGLVDDEEF